MKDWIPLLSSAGVVVSGLIAFAWALISGLRSREKRRIERAEVAEANLSEAQKALIEVHRLEALAWKTRYEGEHSEYVDYRAASHTKAQDMQARLLELTAENAELRSKTDLTPVIQFHQDQGQINLKVVETLDKILERLGGRNGAAV